LNTSTKLEGTQSGPEQVGVNLNQMKKDPVPILPSENPKRTKTSCFLPHKNTQLALT